MVTMELGFSSGIVVGVIIELVIEFCVILGFAIHKISKEKKGE